MCLGHTHSIVGLGAGLAAGDALGWAPGKTAALAGFTAGMALLSDLDQHGSCASRSLGPASELLSLIIHKVSLGHRGLTHTWMGIAGFGAVAVLGGWLRHDWAGKAILGLLVMIAATGALEALHILRSGPADLVGAGIAAAVAFWGWDLSLIMIAAPLGVAAHIGADELTLHGCQFLRPFSQHAFHLLPGRMQISTGHAGERYIVAPVALAFVIVLAVQAADPGLLTAGWNAAISAA